MNAINIDFAQFVQIHHSEPVTTSEFIAKAFGKAHKHILEKIDQISSEIKDSFFEPNFRPKASEVKTGFGKRSIRAYELTKDGFMLLVMGFTGKDAMAIKIAYIEAFNAMAEKLKAMEAPAVQLPHTISAEEAERISEKVLERCGRTGETFQKVYRGLHEYLGVDSYHHIPASMFATAMRYLDSLPQAPELFRQPEQPEAAMIDDETLVSIARLLLHAQRMRLFINRYLPAFENLGLNNKGALWSHVHDTEPTFENVRNFYYSHLSRLAQGEHKAANAWLHQRIAQTV